MVKIKRIYEPAAPDDGFRVLVDRLWPRGLSKEKAKVDLWLKEVAPSDRLRKWYSHDPRKWNQFREEYFKELGHHQEKVRSIMEKMKEGPVTMLFSSKEERLNNAAALKEYIEAKGREVKK
jgi:uncharacterized protein YeaO (DUF488 family)